MAATISVNPMLTSNISDSYRLHTDGFFAGTFLDDPALRNELEGGVVASGVSQPIWGGLPLSLAVPAPGPLGSSSGLGPTATLATAEGNINAWCVYNQASAMMIAGQTAPVATPGMSINFIRPGCNLRLVLPVNPSAVNTIASGAPNQTIYWDFVNFRVDTSGTGALAGYQIEKLNQNSRIPTYNSGTGAVTWATGSAIVVRI